MYFSERDDKLFESQLRDVFCDEKIVQEKKHQIKRAMDFLVGSKEQPEPYVYSINFLIKEIGFFVPETGLKVTFVTLKEYSQQIKIFNFDVLLKKIEDTFFYLESDDLKTKKMMLEAVKRFFIGKSIAEFFVYEETGVVMEIGLFVEETGLKVTFLTKYHPVYQF